jgi:hypothetical protein
MSTIFGFLLYILVSLFVIVSAGVLLIPVGRSAIRLYFRWLTWLSTVLE